MKKNWGFWIIGLVAVCIAVFFLTRGNKLQTLSAEYGKMMAVTDADISYRSKQLPLFGDGLLFYQVQFKDIPFAHHIDKMSIEADESAVKVTLTGVHFNVSDALRAKGDTLIQSFKEYVPFDSIWTQPLETLALAGVENVKLDARFVMEKEGLTRRILGDVQDKKLGRALFDFYIPLEENRMTPIQLVHSTLLSGTFSFEDIALVKPYTQYTKSLGLTPPDNWLKGVTIK